MSPITFWERYKKENYIEKSPFDVLGKKNHSIILDTVRKMKELKKLEGNRFDLEDYKRIFKEKILENSLLNPPSDYDEFEKYMTAPGCSIFTRTGIRLDQVENFEVERSFYLPIDSPDDKIESLKVEPDLVYVEGEARKYLYSLEPPKRKPAGKVLVFDLKTGPFPEEDVFPEDKISIVASAIPVKYELGRLDGIYIVYTQDMKKGTREVDYSKGNLTEVGRIIDKIVGVPVKI